MKAYLIRRFLLIFPTIIGITLLTFMITRVVPGGPVEQAMMEAQFSGAESTGRNDQGGAREGLSSEE